MTTILLMSYFTAADEALHLACSDDGKTFRPVHDGQPVLRSSVGSRHLRDPFIGIVIDSVLTFHDEHFRMRTRQLTGEELGDDMAAAAQSRCRRCCFRQTATN